MSAALEQPRGASTYSASSRSEASSAKAGREALEEGELGRDRPGSTRRWWSMRAPSPRPTSRSLRYSPAHATSPGSTGRSNVASIFETPPVEVMITTITTCGCSASTSTWRIVAVFSEGAETTASRLVICESVSVVARIASSTSRRISDSSSLRGGASEHLAGAEQPVDHVAVAGVGGHAPGRDVGMGEQAVLLEQRQFVAHGRGPAVELRVGGDRARGHRLAGVQVLLHDLAQDRLLAGAQHRV